MSPHLDEVLFIHTFLLLEKDDIEWELLQNVNTARCIPNN